MYMLLWIFLKTISSQGIDIMFSNNMHFKVTSFFLVDCVKIGIARYSEGDKFVIKQKLIDDVVYLYEIYFVLNHVWKLF